jgi:hypothetical protein
LPWSGLPKVPLSLDFHATDAVRFVPVQLGAAHPAIAQADGSDSLHLAPPPRAVPLAEPCQVPDVPTGCDRLDIRNLAQDLESLPTHDPRMPDRALPVDRYLDGTVSFTVNGIVITISRWFSLQENVAIRQ